MSPTPSVVDAMSCCAEIATARDLSAIANALARSAHALSGADAGVSLLRNDVELANARAGRAAPEGEMRSVERRVAASNVVVQLTLHAAADTSTDWVAPLVTIAADTAHRWVLVAEARELARERQEIVAIVSHDLRTPLQSLGLGLDALDMLISDTKAAKPCASTLGRMQRAVTTMGRLLGDLLDVSRVHDGALSMHMKSCDAGRLVSELAEQHTPLAAARGFAFQASATGAGTLVCDAGRLSQAISNLISNAIRHANHGPIELRAMRIGDLVRFEVEDRGPGIPSDARGRLFDRLYQAQESTARRGGLGLGLYIAKGIVAAHGGRIGVDSEVGRGSTFWIEIPRAS